MEGIIHSDEIRYLFWTGGFDSTFRLLELNTDPNVKKIQPIYFSAEIDHENKNISRGQRKSQEKEIETINKITNRLNSPKILKPLIISDEPKYGIKFSIIMRLLAYKKIVRRAKCQIGAMAKYSLDNNIKIEVAIIKSDFMQKTLSPYLTAAKKTYTLKNEYINTLPISIFKNLEFPLINISKSDILEISLKKNWLEILKKTWSCWYPYKNGTPCLRCPMCKNRII